MPACSWWARILPWSSGKGAGIGREWAAPRVRVQELQALSLLPALQPVATQAQPHAARSPGGIARGLGEPSGEFAGGVRRTHNMTAPGNARLTCGKEHEGRSGLGELVPVLHPALSSEVTFAEQGEEEETSGSVQRPATAPAAGSLISVYKNLVPGFSCLFMPFLVDFLILSFLLFFFWSLVS